LKAAVDPARPDHGNWLFAGGSIAAVFRYHGASTDVNAYEAGGRTWDEVARFPAGDPRCVHGFLWWCRDQRAGFSVLGRRLSSWLLLLAGVRSR
jgi:hypothetical protein